MGNPLPLGDGEAEEWYCDTLRSWRSRRKTEAWGCAQKRETGREAPGFPQDCRSGLSMPVPTEQAGRRELRMNANRWGQDSRDLAPWF